MSLLQSIWRSVVYGNLWIAVGALAMYLSTELLLGQSLTPNPGSIFIFFGTLFVYCLFRLEGQKRKVASPGTEMMNWVGRHQRSLLAVAAAALFPALIAVFAVKSVSILCAGVSAVLAMAYAFPLAGGSRRLRDYGLAKAFLIGAVWALTTTLIPLLETEATISVPAALGLFLSRALFISGLTLPFDIRDMDYDRQDGLATIANTQGAVRARRISILLLFAAFAAHLLFFPNALVERAAWQTIAMAGSIGISILLVARIHPDSKEIWYTTGLDGMLVLQFVLLWISGQAVHL